MEMLLFGFGLLYGVFVWRAWKRTALDGCRDKLFDIRDGARAYFIERGIPLDDKAYIGLRKLLNAQLRYTKRVTFPRLMATMLATKNEQAAMDEIKKEIDQSMETNDPELAAYIKEARSQASAALIQYIGETSAFVLFISAVSLPFAVVRRIAALIGHWMDHQQQVMHAGVRTLVSIVSSALGALFSIVPVTGFLISFLVEAAMKNGVTSEAILEEYAYESAVAA